jgi:hypothetical protein
MEDLNIGEMKQSSPESESPNPMVAETNNGGVAESVPTGHSLAKKVYKPPKMVEYGNVARLTAGMNGTNVDPGHNTRSKLGGG